MLTVTDTLVQPAHLWAPPHVSSSGGDAADLAESAGLILEPEQRLLLDVLLAENATGKWAAFEAGVICARQNGKTAALIAMVLADLFLFGTELVVWSAHEVDTALEAFRDIKHIIENSDHLARYVKRTKTGEIAHEANGKEMIELKSGQRLKFKARTRSGGRGLTGDRVVLDEAFALKPSMMGSLVPLMSAKSVHGNPQLVYASSAGQVFSSVLRGVRDRGRAGGDPSLAYVEWCAPVKPCASEWCEHQLGARGCVLDDVEMWRQANPMLDRRISRDYVKAERRILSSSPEEFVRERLGWWDEPQSAQAGMPLDLWEACEQERRIDHVGAVCVDGSVDLSHTSVAVAGDGGYELLAHERGNSWVLPMVQALLADGVQVVIDARNGGNAALLPLFADAGVSVVHPSGLDITQACSAFLDGVVSRSSWHGPHEDLDAAVRGAKRQESGDSFRWSRKSSAVDISPLVAVTLAAWGAQQKGSGPSVYESERGLLVL